MDATAGDYPVPARRGPLVADIEAALKDAMTIEGALGVALVDYSSGMTLGTAGGSAIEPARHQLRHVAANLRL